MVIHSFRRADFRNRDFLCSSVRTKQSRYLWICSQIHSKVIFFVVQILMISLSLAIFIREFIGPFPHGYKIVFIAYVLFIGATSGIWALKLADKVHPNGRIRHRGNILPKLVIIPSYIVQIGLMILFAYNTCHYLVTNISSFLEQSLLFLFFVILIPTWLLWFVILYVFAAEINCFLYLTNRSRHWRHAQYHPPLLNIRALNNDGYPSGKSSSRSYLTTDTRHESESTNCKKSKNQSEPVIPFSSGSRKVSSNADNRIKMMPFMHAADIMASSECSRKGIPLISPQLDPVPEESHNP